MFFNIAIAALLLVLTSSIHMGGMILTMNGTRRMEKAKHSQIFWIGGTVIMMFLVTLLEVIAWGLTYLLLGAIEGWERALYFSMVTFTTLGYGDVLLEERWRVLGSFEAVNGIIMFGWTTAIVIAVVQRVYNQGKHP